MKHASHSHTFVFSNTTILDYGYQEENDDEEEDHHQEGARKEAGGEESHQSQGRESQKENRDQEEGRS